MKPFGILRLGQADAALGAMVRPFDFAVLILGDEAAMEGIMIAGLLVHAAAITFDFLDNVLQVRRPQHKLLAYCRYNWTETPASPSGWPLSRIVRNRRRADARQRILYRRRRSAHARDDKGKEDGASAVHFVTLPLYLSRNCLKSSME